MGTAIILSALRHRLLIEKGDVDNLSFFVVVTTIKYSCTRIGNPVQNTFTRL